MNEQRPSQLFHELENLMIKFITNVIIYGLITVIHHTTNRTSTSREKSFFFMPYKA